MDKIKLINEVVLEINKISEYNNVLSIGFVGLELPDLREIFDKPYNLSTIEVLTEGGALSGVYNGYKKVDKYVMEIIGDESTVNITLSKPNEIEAKISVLEDAVDLLILTGLGVL